MMEKVTVFITTRMIEAGARILSASDVSDHQTAFEVFWAMVEASDELQNVAEPERTMIEDGRHG
jgi:hypothetical protein